MFAMTLGKCSKFVKSSFYCRFINFMALVHFKMNFDASSATNLNLLTFILSDNIYKMCRYKVISQLGTVQTLAGKKRVSVANYELIKI